MTFVDCNNSTARGYSACWNGSILHLHAHGEGETMEIYQDFSPSAIWTYMPIDQGEFISELWARKGRMYRDTALMVRDFSQGKRLLV
jgi:hypothetical protein